MSQMQTSANDEQFKSPVTININELQLKWLNDTARKMFEGNKSMVIRSLINIAMESGEGG